MTFTDNIFDSLQVYRSGRLHFIGISDKDAVRHCRATKQDTPEQLSDYLYVTDGVFETVRQTAKNSLFHSRNGAIILDHGLYHVVKNQEDGSVIQHYINAQDPIQALVLSTAEPFEPLVSRLQLCPGYGDIFRFSSYPGYLIKPVTEYTRYTKKAFPTLLDIAMNRPRGAVV